MEHRKAVTQMAVAYGGDFFVSGSADETVKVWDLRRLERDVAFHSQLTYAAQPGGRITSVAAVEDDASIASASANGSIHVWRVDVARRRAVGSAGGASGGPDKYHGVVALRQLAPGTGAVLDMCSWGPNVLLYITQHGGVHAWDLRVKQDVWRLPCPPSMGLTEHLICEPCGCPGNPVVVPGGGGTWLMTGSSKGHCRLWDVRFQLPASTWQHPTGASISAMAPALAPPSRLGLSSDSLAALSGTHGSAAGGRGVGLGSVGGPLVYVAAGHNEVALWDAAAGRVHQVLRCIGADEHGAPGSPTPSGPTPAANQARHQLPSALQSSQQLQATSTSKAGGLDVQGSLAHSQQRLPGIRCLLPLHSGLLLTGSSDRCIRCWDGARPPYSYLMAGPLWANETLLSAPPSAMDATAGPGSGPHPQQAMGFAVPQFRYHYSSNTRARGVPVVEEQCSLEGVVRLAESSQELRQKMRVHDQSHADALTYMVAAEGYGGEGCC